MKPLVTLPPALRHRRFAMLWLGMLISVAGSQMQLWSLFWHIRTLTDQPAAVSCERERAPRYWQHTPP